MNASGSASAKQVPRFFTPIPGSTNTGTAPTLSNANVNAKNSGLGVTISTVRTPRPMPTRSRPCAMRLLRASSCTAVSSS